MSEENEKFWPTEVNLKESDDRLVITWNDGHLSDFPLRYIRGFCPCAGCQGHRPGAPEFVQTHNEKVVDVRPIGKYGMNIVWDSGHDTGIYSFSFLRTLCPCQEHKPDGIDPDHL